jgi:hypothetical protein
LTFASGGTTPQITLNSNGTTDFVTSTSSFATMNSTNANGGVLSFRRNGTNVGHIGNSAQLGAGVLDAIEVRSGTGSSVILKTDGGQLTLATGGGVTLTGALGGTSGTFSGGIVSNGGAIGYGGGELGFGVTTASSTSAIYTLATGSPIIFFDHRATGNTGGFVFRNGSGGANTLLTIASTGAATFSGTTTAANGSLNIESTDPALRFRVTGGSANKRIYEFRAVAAGGVNDIMQLRLWNDAESSASTLLSIASTGAATFSSSVTATKGILGGSSATSAVANLEVFGSTTVSTNNGQIRINDSATTSKTLSIGVDGANNVAFLQSFQDGVAYRSLILNGLGGNVGIGTASPAQKLEVIGIGSFNNDTSSRKWLINAAGGVIQHSLNGNVETQIAFNGGTTYFLGQNVGIGTASPSSKFVVSNGGAEGIEFGYSSGLGGNYLESLNRSNNLSVDMLYFLGSNAGNANHKFFTSATERMRITSVGNTQPGADNAYSLGVSGTRWSAVWAANGTIQTSDEREKKDIVDSDLGLNLITKLRPVSFKWKVGQNVVTSQVVKDKEGNPILDEEGNEKTESVLIPREGKRTHYGLIAQEVEEVLDGKDFGGFIHDEETDTKGLRYDQFVPLLIKSIQELNDKIAILESKLK